MAVADEVAVTSGGTANSATGARLADDLAAAQALPLQLRRGALTMFSHVPADRFSEGKLVYVSDDLSFDTVDRRTQGVSSILINDINIELSGGGEAIAVWGLSPQSSWQQGNVAKPESQLGKVLFRHALTPGVSIRVTRPSEYWPVTYDPSSGWIYVGLDSGVPNRAIEFVSACVVGLREGQVCGLWLHPEFQ